MPFLLMKIQSKLTVSPTQSTPQLCLGLTKMIQTGKRSNKVLRKTLESLGAIPILMLLMQKSRMMMTTCKLMIRMIMMITGQLGTQPFLWVITPLSSQLNHSMKINLLNIQQFHKT
jgi:hypothetical protein